MQLEGCAGAVHAPGGLQASRGALAAQLLRQLAGGVAPPGSLQCTTSETHYGASSSSATSSKQGASALSKMAANNGDGELWEARASMLACLYAGGGPSRALEGVPRLHAAPGRLDAHGGGGEAAPTRALRLSRKTGHTFVVRGRSTGSAAHSEGTVVRWNSKCTGLQDTQRYTFRLHRQLTIQVAMKKHEQVH
jgi:hypothetical protein